MMGDTGQPPPGGTLSQPLGSRTYASVLGRSLASAKDNNVLEVVLEKDTRGAFSVTELECSNLI